MAPKPTCVCGKCRKCAWRAYMREWYTKNAEQHRKTSIASRERRIEKVREYDRKRKRRDEDPVKLRARWRVKYAIGTGKLQRGPCEKEGDGCKGRIEAHHDDYSKPLDVRWFCQRHHGELSRRF